MYSLRILSLFAVICFGMSSTLQASLIARYKFNGNYNDAAGSYNGASVGTWESLGHTADLADLLAEDDDRGLVYSFTSAEVAYDVDNGGSPVNNYVNLEAESALPNLPADTSVSYSLWVKREADHSSAGTANDFTFLIYLGSYGDAPIFSLALDADGHVNAYYEGDGDQVFMEGSLQVPADTWTHVAFALDRSNNIAQAYVDGVADTLTYRADNGSGAIMSDISTGGTGELNWTGARIGNNAAANDAFVGRLDDVRIYYRALSGAEVTQLAQPYPINADFTAFAVDNWPNFNNFPAAVWQTGNNGRTVDEVTNSVASILYTDVAIADTIIRGTITPGADDDVVGIVLAYDAGEATSASADYLLLDWKGLTQNFDFTGSIHEATTGGTMPAGLALSRVTGAATADELWQHNNQAANTDGGVEELARGNVFGSTGYGSGTYTFEIHYSTSEIVIYVNNVEEFRVSGTFPATGSYGIYEMAQDPGLTATNFAVLLEDTDNGLRESIPFVPTPNPPAEVSTENPYGLTAYVYEIQDATTQRTGAAELLRRAGFHVQTLPLDQAPFNNEDDPEDDVDLVFFGSHLAGTTDYDTYMASYATILDDYIDRAGMLVHMAQNGSSESVPPFLPDTQDATRTTSTFNEGYVITPGNPLIANIAATTDGDDTVMSYDFVTNGGWANNFGWNTFDFFAGFEVILAGETNASDPIMMEGAYGQGRFLMTAMAFDKFITAGGEDAASTSQAAFNEEFFRNLYEHTKNVRDRTVPNLTPTPPPGDSNLEAGAWTLAVLPDTQIYSQNYPGMFMAQTGWIRDNVRKSNIRYVLHLGDIVNVNSEPEWKNAAAAFGILDGVVPYAFVPGNHDYGPGGNAATRATFMNNYLRYTNYTSWPTFGGAMVPGMMDNTYHLFDAWGHRFIVICLEWGPLDSTINWAKGILDQYPDRYAILVTHAYMNNNDLRYDITDTGNPQAFNPHFYSTPGPVNDGQELWDKLVSQYNFVLTLNGHVLGDGTGYRTDVNDLGNTVHQMLVNYQMRSLGGEAYIRLLEFQPDGRTVRVRSYSPVYNNFLLASDQDFSFIMDLGQTDVDEDGVLDYHDADYDWDNDGLNNKLEFETYGSFTRSADTDGDGLTDLQESQGGTPLLTANTDILNYVQNNPGALGLYNDASVGDLGLGLPMIMIENNTLRIMLQPEISDDLGSWQDLGDPIEWSTPMQGDKQFYRFKLDNH